MAVWKNGKRVRDRKGLCVTGLPLDYVVIDIETTGLDSYSSIIEASALRVRRGEVTKEFSSLIKPPKLDMYRDGQWQEGYVDRFITGLTGITDDMLETAPRPKEILPELLEFIGGDVLLGHNVHFDINFLYDAFEEHVGLPLGNDFMDTLRISRKLLPQLPHHRLSDLAGYFGVSYAGAHRALADCIITHDCYLCLRDMALANGTESDFAELFKKGGNRGKRDSVALGKADNKEVSTPEDTSITGKRIAFVGKLQSMSKAEAKELVAALGGIPDDAINSRTDYLVVGGASSSVPLGAGTSVISEQAFFGLLGSSEGKPEIMKNE